MNQTNAAEQTATSVVTGNYNGVLFKTATGITCEVLSIPSIVSTEGSDETSLINILTGKKLVYNGYNNLPSNYKGSKYKTTAGFEFEINSENLVIYSDTQECKPLYAEDGAARKTLITNLQKAYSGTIIQNTDKIKAIVSVNPEDTQAVEKLSSTLVSNNLGGKVTSNTPTITTQDGECGTANKTYAYTDTDYGTDTFCANGLANPTTPNFPTEGSPVNWDCEGTGQPIGTTTNCSSEITATPINGTCGSANNQATLTSPTTNLCTTGTQTSVTTNPGTFTWSCNGVNLGTTSSCSAPRQYTVTFDETGGTTVSDKTITYNTAVGTLPTPTKSGYTFNGWFTATSGGTQITTGIVITGNVTYYAQWTAPITSISLCTEPGQIGNETTNYSSCTVNNIIICSGNGTGYIISACNVGTDTAGVTEPSYGNFYQFGKNDISWVNGNSSWNNDWKTPGGTNAGSANDWGVEDAENITATYLNQNPIDQAKMRGPCLTGYHVPTYLEWTGLVIAGGWSTNGNAMSTILNLPKAGAYRGSDKNYYGESLYGLYWTSSPLGNKGYRSSLGATTIGSDRSFGFPIRCFKN